VCALAFAHNRRIAPHTGFSGGLSQLAALHLAAATPELFGLEYMFIDNPARELFSERYPVPQHGVLEPPAGPGWGLQLDLERIEHMKVDAA
jgi:L-alanine-DL-glutamate epimerase-like enolase superfamily enzyme